MGVRACVDSFTLVWKFEMHPIYVYDAVDMHTQ
jgi:hypothetical protein